MKKMISCIAALAIIAAIPAATVFAAESAPATGAEVSVTSETAYDETDIRNITGRWKYQVAEEGKNITTGVIDSGYIDVNEDGTFIYTDLEGKTCAGTVNVDYDTMGGEYHVPFFAFSGDSGFYIICYCAQNDKDVYITGNGGMSQLVRVAQENEKAAEEITDEKSAEKNVIAVSRMEDFNTIMAIMNASPLQTVNDAVVNDHVKVKDSRFTSIGAFKSFVSKTFTGELRDRIIRECDDCFTEHEGALYVKNAARSFFRFKTIYGAAVVDPAMDSFSALTMCGDELFGNGWAEFRIEDGRWKISRYKYGTWSELMAVENYDISAVAGIWYEDTESSCNVINIRTDGTFSYSYDSGTDFGTVQAVYRLNENGEKVIDIELVKDNSANFFAGFKAPDETPCNDFYLDQEGSSTHYVRREESGAYTVEQLSDMAAKDYEEKTGVKPSNTQPIINDDNSVTVAVYDENATPVDAYHIDPDTGKGTLNSDNSEVDLPQTGNNSLGTAVAVVSAMVLAVAGAFAVLKSGILRQNTVLDSVQHR